MNILKIKRALAELVWTGALLFAAASVFLRPGAAAGGVLRGLSVCYETVIPALFALSGAFPSAAGEPCRKRARPAAAALYPFAWPAQPKGPRSHAVRRAGGLCRRRKGSGCSVPHRRVNCR